MADDFGVYDITAALQTIASSSLSTALRPVSGNINIRRGPERRTYESLLLGTNVSSSLVPPPSWTQAGVGKKHAFVISEISSSQHEVISQNAFFSGNFPLETTAVPASASSFYSKGRQLVSLVYKLSASAGLPETPAVERNPSIIENLSRTTFHSISGSYRNNSYFNPAVFTIDVPEYGKIRDIKVWVELIHDHRGGTGISEATASNPFYGGGTGSAEADTRHGLQGLQLALRSPNSSFKFAHPLWNDPTVSSLEKGPEIISTQLRAAPELLRSSYLLWAGHAVERDLGITLGSQTSSLPDNKNTNQVVYFSSSGSFTGYRDIVVDENDRIHLSYHERQSGSLMYASSSIDAASWSVMRIDSEPGGNSYGLLNSICVGKNADRHFAYNDAISGTLKYARVTGTFSPGIGIKKTIEIVDSVHDPANGLSIALDSNGNPCIAYVSNVAQEIFLARSGSTGWAVERVFDKLTPRSGPVKLIFGDDGSPNVFYQAIDPAGVRYTLYHARSGTTGWREYLIYSGGFISGKTTQNFAQSIGAPSFFKDPNGNFHGCSVAYFYDGGFDVSATNLVSGIIYLRSGSTTGWVPELVMSASQEGAVGTNYTLGNSRTIAVGPNGVPQIVFQRGINPSGPFTLLYARSSSLGWSVQDIDLGQNNFGARNATIAVDSVNDPHIVYVDRENSSNLITTGSQEYIRIKGTVSGAAYFSYDTDIDMRTVFHDSSPNQNPRHVKDLYSSPGISQFPSLRLLKEGSYPSPLSASIRYFGGHSSYRYLRPYEGAAPIDQVHFLTGSNFPWMLDSRIPPGNFVGRNYSATSSLSGEISGALAIPPGWLTGPGGAANTNEWQTFGVQLGPGSIKPVYPLLDDIFVERVYDQPLDSNLQYGGGAVAFPPFHLPKNGPKISGFRPGLRGTEVHGKWQLLIGNTADFDPTAGDVPATGSERSGFWFRQFRVEFVVDTGAPQRFGTYASKDMRFRKSGHVASSPGKRLVQILSGSSAWDIGINHIFSVQPEEYGRSVGITDASGSSQFAVFSQLTGTLVDILSGSGNLSAVRGSYLNNEFGTPYIPVSSGSSTTPSFDSFSLEDLEQSRTIFAETLNSKTLVPRDNTLKAHLSRADVLKTTRDIILKKVGSL